MSRCAVRSAEACRPSGPEASTSLALLGVDHAEHEDDGREGGQGATDQDLGRPRLCSRRGSGRARRGSASRARPGRR